MRLGRYDYLNAFFSAVGAVFVAIIARVGDNLAWGEVRQQRPRLRAVAGLDAGGQAGAPRCPARRYRQGFQGSFRPGCGPTIRLRRRFFWAGGMLVRPPHGRIEHDPIQIGFFQRLAYGFPHAFFSQTMKATAHEIAFTEALGQVCPRRTSA